MDKKKRWWALCITGLFLLVMFMLSLDHYTKAETETLTAENGIGEMTAGHRYSQKFTFQSGMMEAIEVHLATFWRVNDSRLTVRLLEDGSERQTWQVDCRRLEDSGYYTFQLDKKIEDPQGKSFELEFVPDGEAGNAVTAYANQTAGRGGYCLDGEEVPGTSLCYRIIYRRDSWNFYTVLGLLFIPGAAALLWVVTRTGGGRPERQFLILWIAFSLLFAVSNTLFNVPDETAHFYRAFEVAQGHAVSVLQESAFDVGRELPIDGNLTMEVFRESWASFWQHAGLRESSTPSFRSFFNTALYAPVSYIPQAAGIALARLFTDRLVVLAYAGRLVNWLSITVLSYAALCLLPRGKRFFSLFLLMPMSLQEGFSLAPDGMVVAVAVLMTALVMHLRETHEGRLRPLQLGILYVLALLISLYKIVYMPLCLLYLLIPAEKFGGKRKKTVHAVVMAAMAVGLNLWWLSLCGGFLIKKGADSALQTAYILGHPLRYGLILLRTLTEGAGGWLEGMVGSYLAWMDVALPKILVFAFLLRLAAGLRPERVAKRTAEVNSTAGQKHQDWKADIRFERAVLIFTIASVVILICTSLYVQWTPPYRPFSEGIQGRYFTALLAPLYLAFHPIPAGAGERMNCMARRDCMYRRDCMNCMDLALTVIVNTTACLLLLFSCIAG